MKHLSEQGRLPVFLFTLFYVAAATIGFYIGGNYEFSMFGVVMFFGVILIAYLLRDVHVPNGLLWALSIAGMLHLAGGGLHVHGERLYSYMLVNFYNSPTDPGLALFRYDQFVHFTGYGVVALVMHYIVRRAAPNSDVILRALITIVITIGLGAINEIAEFAAVLMLPSTGVGDYFNTMLDITFNTLGAMVAVALYETFVRLKKKQ